MTFRVLKQYFGFLALDSVHFAHGKAGNILRGAFGMVATPLPEVSVPLPSGLAEPPRPFVFRAAHLDGATIPPGGSFELGVNFFDLKRPLVPLFAAAFSELERTGLGPRRPRVVLQPLQQGVVVEVDLREAEPVNAVAIRFSTPTELKGNPTAAQIPFGVLFGRIRDRVSTLATLYGAGAPEVDFKALGERAQLIGPGRADLHYEEVMRISSRTGQTHDIGGFTGTVEYEGEMGEFMPWLRAAALTGIGRHTVWGNGVIDIVVR